MFGFNEAPIHESGKWRHGGHAPGGPHASMRPRFMNRGSTLAQAALVDLSLASMRPRFMNRGSLSRSSATPRRMLRFNEAPIHESGKCHRARPLPESHQLASMRPRFMNRGSAGALEGCDQVRPASMRPRFMNRGSHGCRSEGRGCPAASMRPRFMNRGSPSEPWLSSTRRRRFNEAPIHESGKSVGASELCAARH